MQGRKGGAGSCSSQCLAGSQRGLRRLSCSRRRLRTHPPTHPMRLVLQPLSAACIGLSAGAVPFRPTLQLAAAVSVLSTCDGLLPDWVRAPARLAVLPRTPSPPAGKLHAQPWCSLR
jgi:hypothetical protein